MTSWRKPSRLWHSVHDVIGTSGLSPRKVADLVMLMWQVVHSAMWTFFSPPPSCMNFKEILIGAAKPRDGVGASLWQPTQFVAIGCCAFQCQLKHESCPEGTDLKVSDFG